MRGIGIGGTSVRSTLGIVLGKGSVSCGIRSGVICLSRGSTTPRRNGRRKGRQAVAKIISSSVKPLVNIGMLVGNADGKYVASLSNGFALAAARTGPIVMFSCVNCAARRVPIGNGTPVGMVVTKSARRLRRIIIATLNVGHSRGTLSCGMRRIGASTVASGGSTGFIGSLDNGMTNIGVGTSSSNMNNMSGMIVHNAGSVVRSSGTLCMVSNIPVFSNHNATKNGRFSSRKSSRPVTSVGPRSVRSVSILANTTTTTLCNSRTTGNTVIVAAGGNGRNGIDLAIDDGARFAGPFIVPDFRGHCNAKANNIVDASKTVD